MPRYATWEDYARFFVQMSMALDAVMAYSLFVDSELLVMIDWPVLSIAFSAIMFLRCPWWPT